MACKVVSADRILQRAVVGRLVTVDEATTQAFKDAADMEADWTNKCWPEREGFGSSDFTAVLARFLHIAGVKTAYVYGRLTRVPS